jgi:predicted nucleic acid-binding protein
MVWTETADHAVCDSGPLIHLDELNALRALNGYRLLIPNVVCLEVERHREGVLGRLSEGWERLAAAEPPGEILRALQLSLALDAGETEGLSLLRCLPESVFLTDGGAARVAAEHMGYRVHGTVGLVIRAVRRGKYSPQEAVAHLESIPRDSSLHIRSGLLYVRA